MTCGYGWRKPVEKGPPFIKPSERKSCVYADEDGDPVFVDEVTPTKEAPWDLGEYAGPVVECVRSADGQWLVPVTPEGKKARERTKTMEEVVETFTMGATFYLGNEPVKILGPSPRYFDHVYVQNQFGGTDILPPESLSKEPKDGIKG